MMAREKRPPGGRVMWYGHHAHAFILVAVATFVISDLAGRPSWITVPAFVAAVIMISAAIIGLYHDRHLCVRCVDNSPFDDPETAVEKRRRELKLFHSTTLLLVLSGANALVMGYQVVMTYRDGLQVEWWILALDIAVLLLYAYNSFIFLVHKRLALWCPYCRDDRDDDDDDDGGDGGPPDPHGRRGVRRVLVTARLS